MRPASSKPIKTGFLTQNERLKRLYIDKISTYIMKRYNNFLKDKGYTEKNLVKDVEKITERKYEPFEYFGDKNATNVLVIMGSGVETAQETVEFLPKIFNYKVLADKITSEKIKTLFKTLEKTFDKTY